MQAKLPPDKLWRFCPAGSTPTAGHATRPLGDGNFLERFLLERTSLDPSDAPLPDPSIPVWRIFWGDVPSAKLSRGYKAGDGTWMWRDLESEGFDVMFDGTYRYVACEGETFLRAAIVDKDTTLSAGATVLTAGTLEVSDGVLDFIVW